MTPSLTSVQMYTLEKSLIHEFGLDLASLINRAGNALASLAKRYLDDELVDRPIVVLAGQAMSGAVGLAAARTLLDAGAWVQTLCPYPIDEMPAAVAQQWMALQAAGGQLSWAEEGWELPPCDLLIDALLGHGLHEDAQGRVRELMLLANSSAAPILSVDVPSGVDSDNGRCYSPHINAVATMMLGFPKAGLMHQPARNTCGTLYLAEIGIPDALYQRFGLKQRPEFDAQGLLALQE